MPTALVSEVSRVYVTYFDKRYLSRGLALIRSLREQGENSQVLVLGLDEEVLQYFLTQRVPQVEVIKLADIEEFEPRLLGVRGHRSKMEYIFTLTPVLIQLGLKLFPDAEIAVYLDADLYFLGSPESVIDSLGSGDVGIIPHRYEKSLQEKLSRFGTYNVGWVAFRRSPNGTKCLNYWYESCLTWCFDKPSDGRYADQGYLDKFPSVVPTVKVLDNPGLNFAPWNVANHILESDSAGLKVDRSALVFFHFHGLKQFGNFWVTAEATYGTRLSQVLKSEVYIPYVKRLLAIDRELRAKQGIESKGALMRGRGLGANLAFVSKPLLVARRCLAGSCIVINEGQT